MKIAYLILAHRSPQQLQRLLRRLEYKDAKFFIHVDRQCNFSLFKKAVDGFGSSKVQFVKREYSRWGHIGLVKATLNGIEEIVKEGLFDYIVLLSGQCYPLVSPPMIHQFFEEHYGKIFIDHFPLPAEDWLNGGVDRIERYHFFLQYQRVFPDYTPPLTLKGKFFNALLKLYFRKPRVFPSYLKPYGGSQFFNITASAARYILDFHRKHPDHYEFHKYSYVPDELFFQTILLNSPDEMIARNIVNDNLRFIETDKNLGTYPATLTRKDFSAIIHSEKLFARKFNDEVDTTILDMIDQYANRTPVI